MSKPKVGCKRHIHTSMGMITMLHELLRWEAMYQTYRERHAARAAQGQHRYHPASRIDWWYLPVNGRAFKESKS